MERLVANQEFAKYYDKSKIKERLVFMRNCPNFFIQFRANASVLSKATKDEKAKLNFKL